MKNFIEMVDLTSIFLICLISIYVIVKMM